MPKTTEQVEGGGSKVPEQKHDAQERQWEREEDARDRDKAEAEMQEELRGGA